MMDKSTLHAFMSRARYGVVSSLAVDGSPQSALVGVAITSELGIVFDTLKTTRKYLNLVARPACSVVLWWGGEQTVQLDGTAFEPAGAERDSYREAYFVAWPDGRDRLAWAGITHLVVRPHWVRVTDYDQAPPLIEELRF
jgi:pyridoxine/pyridoxamine 5'-phosphate oxidase